MVGGGAIAGYLALGGNLGEVAANFRAALADLQAAGYTVARVSSLYRSRPWSGAGPDYLNAAVAVAGPADARALLAVTQELERRAGRVAGGRNAPRPLDIDILFWGKAVAGDAALTLPHPRWRERDFVLRPLAEVMPAAERAAWNWPLPPAAGYITGVVAGPEWATG